jgi:hypothetical protein
VICERSQAPSGLGYFITKAKKSRRSMRTEIEMTICKDRVEFREDGMEAWEDTQMTARKDGLPRTNIGV